MPGAGILPLKPMPCQQDDDGEEAAEHPVEVVGHVSACGEDHGGGGQTGDVLPGWDADLKRRRRCAAEQDRSLSEGNR